MAIFNLVPNINLIIIVMKNMHFFSVIVFTVTLLFSQINVASAAKFKTNEDRDFKIPLIGQTAPSFTAESTNGTIEFPSDYGRSWKILFSHPQDFTPVCSTEILELANQQDIFDILNVKVVVVSTDRLETHVDWKKALEMIKVENRGQTKIKFPLVEDVNISIAKLYGMIHPETNSTYSVRGVFIIDPDNVIQAISFYPMNVGRNINELIRTVAALQKSAKEKVLTPVNWKIGDDVLVKVPPRTDENNPGVSPEGYYSPSWFICYKKATDK
jgi:peroxiredoxin (alkyl hydroperoxide reductase subunit C)